MTRFESGWVRLPKKRSARAWNRDDSLLVLAAYFDRPPRQRLPSERERQRIANLTRQDVAEVTRRCAMFAGLDPHNPSDGEPAGARERRLWERYADDRMACGVAADAVLESLRRLPPALRKD